MGEQGYLVGKVSCSLHSSLRRSHGNLQANFVCVHSHFAIEASILYIPKDYIYLPFKQSK